MKYLGYKIYGTFEKRKVPCYHSDNEYSNYIVYPIHNKKGRELKPRFDSKAEAKEYIRKLRRRNETT